MSRARGHDVHALAGAYALDALPPDEERSFQAHLRSCASCRVEVAEMRATAAQLGVAGAEPAPPELRARVLAAIDVTRQEPATHQHVQQPEPTSPWTRARWSMVAAAAAIVLVIVGLTGLVARLNARIDQLEARSAAVHSVLAAPDVRTVELHSEGTASARVVVSAQAGEAVLVARGLPALPDEQAFQLWFIDQQGPQPGDVFRAADDGRAVLVLDHDLRDVDLLGVTVEPARGSTTPSADPFLLGEV